MRYIPAMPPSCSKREAPVAILSGAEFDATATYRYRLWREWNRRLPRLGFIMLNPSRADATANDPTIRRCLGFAQTWGFGAIEVMNLFAFRAVHPTQLKAAADPIGADNDAHLLSLAHRADSIVLAWGNWGSLGDRDRAVVHLLRATVPLYCLGHTQQGQPRHPLYLKATTTLRPFAVRD